MSNCILQVNDTRRSNKSKKKRKEKKEEEEGPAEAFIDVGETGGGGDDGSDDGDDANSEIFDIYDEGEDEDEDEDNPKLQERYNNLVRQFVATNTSLQGNMDIKSTVDMTYVLQFHLCPFFTLCAQRR